MKWSGLRIIGGWLVTVLVIFAVGLAVLWNYGPLQDRVMKRVIASRLSNDEPAKLLNDDALHVFLCGTGSPMPDPSRANACSAVIAGGHIVIIDTGPGSWSKFAQSRLPAGKIDKVLLTHLHSDHIGDLGEFATQSWIAGRMTPLSVTGPGALPVVHQPKASNGVAFGASDTVALVKGFAAAYNSDAAYRILHHGADHLLPDAAEMIGENIPTPAKDELVTVYDRAGLTISAFLVDHNPIEPAYGFRAEYKGRVAVFSGDTVKTESVVRFSKGADVLIHEALSRDMVSLISDVVSEAGNSRLGDMATDTLDYHTSPVEAAEIANIDGVKLLVYSHVVPPLVNALTERMFMRGVKEARGDGDTRIGYDGMLVTLPANSEKVEVSKLF